MASESGNVLDEPSSLDVQPSGIDVCETQQLKSMNEHYCLASTRNTSAQKTARDDGQLPWSKTWQRVEVGVICVVIVVVWGLLSLPIIFYYTPPDYSDSIIQMNESGLQSCSVYNGTICAEPLQSLQYCLPDKELNLSELYVSPNKSQAEVEGEAQLILMTVLEIPNSTTACTAAIVPFLCLNLFKLCDSNGTSYLPSSSECVDLRSGTCVEIWDAANRLLVSIGLDPLPTCESLPETSVSCEANGVPETSSGHPDSTNGTNSSIQCTRHCRDGFYCVDDLNICKPRCDEWEIQSHSKTVALDVAVILSSVANLVLGTLIVVLSCIKRKTMFVFPLVLVVYMAITTAVVGIFLLVQYIDRPGLYCSSIDLEESIDNSTPFCSITGFVFHYIILQLTLWWFFNIAILFWRMQFPFHAKSFQQAHGFKHLHVTVVILGVVLPIFASVSWFATGGFVMRWIPPVICYTRDSDATFYSVILPIIVMYIFGIPMLVITFWTIHKHYGLVRAKRSQHPIKFGTSERKILLICCYYIILIVISITSFTLSNRNGDKIKAELDQYFICESTAPDSPCDTSGYRDHYHIELLALAYMLFGLCPAPLLIFVVSIKEVNQLRKLSIKKLSIRRLSPRTMTS